jgi:UDP-galactopyranose mutase
MREWLVVGAGFAGSILAERIATERGEPVRVIDRRPHIGGNAFDRPDAAGILMHQYGPHIFHTNSDQVFQHLSRFTSWRPYEHRVLASVDGQLVPIPINRTTLNTLYGAGLATEAEAEAFLAARAEPVGDVRTSEDVVVARVGRDLYEKFFRGYTRKQWGRDPSLLDKSVTARIPVRTNTDDRYFTDRHQAMPAAGYTAMFGAMLDHPLIRVETGVEFDAVRQRSWRGIIYTGPIDAYFGCQAGRLPYRSLRFEHRTLDQARFQPVGTVNYPQDQAYTRITEYKHLTGQVHPRTTITMEFPAAEGDPYYPVPCPDSAAMFATYQALADRERDTLFVGRLASYRYYNMDQVVAQALSVFRRMQGVAPADPDAAREAA